MSAHILARELDDLVAILADLGDYVRDDDREPGSEFDRRSLETFTADALLAAVKARQAVELELAAVLEPAGRCAL